MSNSLPSAKFYNYIYLDPRKPGRFSYEGLPFSLLYEPFYVGKGTGERKFYHLKYQNYSYERNKYKKNKIKKISKFFELSNFIFQPNKNLEENISLEFEKFLIETIGRLDLKTGPLTNQTPGGIGGTIGKEVWNKGKTLKELLGSEYIHPNKGKTKKEICGEDYVHPRLGKKLKDSKGEDYIDPRKGKTGKEIYGEDYVDPKKGRVFEKIFCIKCRKPISCNKLTNHYNVYH